MIQIISRPDLWDIAPVRGEVPGEEGTPHPPGFLYSLCGEAEGVPSHGPVDSVHGLHKETATLRAVELREEGELGLIFRGMSASMTPAFL